MRSDFINKRDVYRRRSGGGNPPQTKECNLILLPTFDTFIFHNPFNPGSDRWSFIDPSNGTPNTSTNLIVGLLNPLNDADDQPDPGGFGGGIQIPPRTATRSILAYNLTELPVNATILSSTLNLTVNGRNAWGTQEDAGETPQQNSPGLEEQIRDFDSVPIDQFNLMSANVGSMSFDGSEADMTPDNIPYYDPSITP